MNWISSKIPQHLRASASEDGQRKSIRDLSKQLKNLEKTGN